MTDPQSLSTSAPGAGRPGWKRVCVYILLVCGAVLSVFPFLFMVSSSLKSYGSIITNSFWPWPPLGTESPQFVNFEQAIITVGWDKSWNTWLFLRYFVNSGIVALGVTTGVLITSTCAAYALAQMRIPGKNVVFVAILATLMVPNDLTLVPKVVMMYQLDWYNTYLALIVPFLTSVFAIFLLRQFFMQIPKELYDAAVIDGAGHLRYLWSVVVPLSRPAVVTIALLQFIWSWDEFKWPLLVTRDASMRVVAVGLQQFNVGEGGTKTHLLMSFATVVVIPVVVGYFLTQKYFTQGFLTSGIKG